MAQVRGQPLAHGSTLPLQAGLKSNGGMDLIPIGEAAARLQSRHRRCVTATTAASSVRRRGAPDDGCTASTSCAGWRSEDRPPAGGTAGHCCRGARCPERAVARQRAWPDRRVGQGDRPGSGGPAVSQPCVELSDGSSRQRMRRHDRRSRSTARRGERGTACGRADVTLSTATSARLCTRHTGVCLYKRARSRRVPRVAVQNRSIGGGGAAE